MKDVLFLTQNIIMFLNYFPLNWQLVMLWLGYAYLVALQCISFQAPWLPTVTKVNMYFTEETTSFPLKCMFCLLNKYIYLQASAQD